MDNVKSEIPDEGMLAKVKNGAQRLALKALNAKNALMAWLVCGMCTVNAYAFTICTSYCIDESNLEGMDPQGLIMGLAFWVCRLIGVAMLIWGIYGYVTARKDGEAESMNSSIGKLISGIVLIAMPSVLSALGILQ